VAVAVYVEVSKQVYCPIGIGIYRYCYHYWHGIHKHNNSPWQLAAKSAILLPSKLPGFLVLDELILIVTCRYLIVCVVVVVLNYERVYYFKSTRSLT
jgi:hypothetical protein